MVETIISRKLGDQDKAEQTPFELEAVETSMEALFKEYTPKNINTDGMFILQLRNDKIVGTPITQLCQYQTETKSCPLSDCPCGHYKGNGNSGSTSASTNQAQSQQTKPEPLKLPALIYQTQREMDDYDARDMHHGDLSRQVLEEKFNLQQEALGMNAISTDLRVYDFEKNHFFGENEKLTKDEVANSLFDEFRFLANVYSFHGEYKHVIKQMITHMQKNTGQPFSSNLLDQALHEQIEEDDSKNSSLEIIRSTLESYIDWENKSYPESDKQRIEEAIRDTKLPRFDSWNDYTNGLVISVHDSWATHITLQSLEIKDSEFTAVIHYQVQDHFGLDDGDLTSIVKQQRIFRIWFVLQRWEKLGFKPFITEMNTSIKIKGIRK
ncbi:YPO3983 family protein [Vibrio quintilis]|uniref:DUF3289 family protein n=1 Tax=Vibrio quintilis TaxID=1117707 RepID=A0A1M7Z022_9VIBR|nr:DUF3289 family protein [Vibrio quintilis]SHO58241.1 hypothetical protein VQ7734_04011 [Vibrio quintilis]